MSAEEDLAKESVRAITGREVNGISIQMKQIKAQTLPAFKTKLNVYLTSMAADTVNFPVDGNGDPTAENLPGTVAKGLIVKLDALLALEW